jgi:ABC-2 type transport system ATP-binding protein
VAAAIESAGLTRRYGRMEAVSGLDLRVPAGSVFALIGPNGAGKTTTIKLLMNLIPPTRGTATVLRVDSRRIGVGELARIGYVSENQRLPDWMTPAELLDARSTRPGTRTLYGSSTRISGSRLGRHSGISREARA